MKGTSKQLRSNLNLVVLGRITIGFHMYRNREWKGHVLISNRNVMQSLLSFSSCVERFAFHFLCCSVFWISNPKGPMFFFLYLREYLVLLSQGVTNQDASTFITQVGAFEPVNHVALLSFNQLISFFFPW